VDVRGALTYAPKTAGVPTNPGELLMSRINPRIPRVCVTPDFGVPTLCSSEFEIMKPATHVDVYTLAYILQVDWVQSQVRSLTSGTSSSHNRIKTRELAQVLIPIPRHGTIKERKLGELVRAYHEALDMLTTSATKLATIRANDDGIFAS